MTIRIDIIYPNGIDDISEKLLLKNGKLKLLSYKDYDNFTRNELRVFCHKYARYGIPTIELIEYLKEIINGRTCIEIGSGHGDLGFHLGVPMTDSKLQFNPRVRKHYEMMGQPIIEYPNDVEKLESLDAIKKYKPQVVIGSWITTYSPIETHYPSNPYGFKEDKILGLVETFIIIGNLDNHGKKPIRRMDHEEIKKPFIVSRGINQDNNRIFIWNR